jgi:GTP-binding protein
VGYYPFTTTRPQLGVVSHHDREFVIADIPGLIEGAADGAGIGDRFLGHVERTRVLLHLVDGSGEDPLDAYEIVRGEIEGYGAGLDEKDEVIALTKSDLLDEKARAKLVKRLEKETGKTVYPISAPLDEGVDPLLDAMIEKLGEVARESRDAATDEKPWTPL